MGSHNVGTHFMSAMIIRVVPLDACHPGLSPGWHIHTHSGSERHHHQKWAVGLKCIYMEGSKRALSPGFNIQRPSRQRQGCRFLICLLSRAQGDEGTLSQHHSTIPGSKWSHQSSLKYHYKGVKIQSCLVVLSSICPKTASSRELQQPWSGHRTAGDSPLAKNDTLLSCILYW